MYYCFIYSFSILTDTLKITTYLCKLPTPKSHMLKLAFKCFRIRKYTWMMFCAMLHITSNIISLKLFFSIRDISYRFLLFHFHCFSKSQTYWWLEVIKKTILSSKTRFRSIERLKRDEIPQILLWICIGVPLNSL